MKPAQARNLAVELEAAGLVISAVEGKHEAKGLRALHGTASVEGWWAHSDHHAVIVCDHVALALLDASRWTVEAIRACEHRFGVRPKAKPRTRRATHCPGCRCAERAARMGAVSEVAA
jgi:hypothetical protein